MGFVMDLNGQTVHLCHRKLNYFQNLRGNLQLQLQRSCFTSFVRTFCGILSVQGAMTKWLVQIKCVGNPVVDYSVASHPGGSRNSPSHFLLWKTGYC